MVIDDTISKVKKEHLRIRSMNSKCEKRKNLLQANPTRGFLI